jgi:major type 1 subunit fimbrin (pilin)/fimbrial protein
LKKSLLALSLGLAAGVAGTSAFANTGTINFEGQITSGSCPIEVVNPADNSIGNQVKMGSVAASRFTATGQEHGGKSFALRVPDNSGCNITANSKASVKFNGTPDPSGSYFALTPTPDAAKDVVIALKDRSGTPLVPGTSSPDYDLNDSGPTDLLFYATYRSTATTVTAGRASADVQFVVDIN